MRRGELSCWECTRLSFLPLSHYPPSISISLLLTRKWPTFPFSFSHVPSHPCQLLWMDDCDSTLSIPLLQMIWKISAGARFTAQLIKHNDISGVTWKTFKLGTKTETYMTSLTHSHIYKSFSNTERTVASLKYSFYLNINSIFYVI